MAMCYRRTGILLVAFVLFLSLLAGVPARIEAQAPAVPGVCYATLGNNDPNAGFLITIDRATGAGTIVGPTGIFSGAGAPGVPALAIKSTGEIFATDIDYSSDLYRIDAATGMAIFVATTGLVAVPAIAFDGHDVLYAVDNDTGELYVVDDVTGEATLVGPTRVPIRGLAFDPTNGQLWGSDNVGGIYIINKSTGAAALIGNTGVGACPDIHFDQVGNLYGSVGGGAGINSLIAIDKVTGAGTVIGSIGFQAVSGMAARLDRFAPASAQPGMCYATLGNNDPDVGSLITIDRATGAGTLVGPTGISGEFADGVPALAIKSTGEIFVADISDPSNLYEVDAATGAAALVAITQMVPTTAMAFDGIDRLFAVDVLGELYVVNELTGESTLIGSTSLDIRGLAFDPTTGILWASEVTGGIYTIDWPTGAATLVGNTGLGPCPDIHFDQAGNLYGSVGGGGAPNNLVSIDKATGAGTVIGSIGFTSVSGMGARLDRVLDIAPAVPGVCYATLGNNDPDPGSLITIDRATGAGTLVGPTGIVGQYGPGVPALAIKSTGEIFAADIADASGLYRIDAVTGAASLVATTDLLAIPAMAFDGYDVLYAMDVGTEDLHVVDDATGETTRIGPAGVPIRGLAFDPLTGVLWGSDDSGGIYTLNTATGAATLVGNTGVGACPDIHFDQAGNLYGSIGGGAGGVNDLISIDKATGAGTVIGSIGFESVSGMAGRLDRFAPALAQPGVCYATLGNNDPDAGSLITIDPATGAGTLVGPTGIVGQYEVGVPALAIKSTGHMFVTDISDSSRLYRVDAVTGTATLVAVTDLLAVPAIAFDGSDRLFAMDINGGLYIVDEFTGATTLMGSTGEDIRGLAFDPTTGILWASEVTGAIYTIDWPTGAATLVGNTGLGPCPDIHFDQAGNLYGSVGGGGAPNNLISIDKATGAGTVIGSIGFTSVSGMAARLDRVLYITPAQPDVCYATLGNNDPNAGALITIDRVTGAGTLVGPTGIAGQFDNGVPALAIKPTGEMYASDISAPSNLYRIDAATGSAVMVAMTDIVAIPAMAFDGNGVLYAMNVVSDDLHVVNEATGRTALVGPAGVPIRGLAFDPLTGILWGSDDGGGIYTISTANGAATLVGNTGLGPCPDIHFDQAGNLYASVGGGGGVNDLISIDKATGAGTVIGSIGFVSVSGMAARLNRPAQSPALPGVCYATLGNSDPNAGSLITIDPATGAGTLVGPTGIFSGVGAPGVPALAIKSTGEMFVADIDIPSALYRVDAATGAASVVASTSLLAIPAMAFDPFDVLYAIDINMGDLYVVDDATGAVTLVGPTGIDVRGLAFDPTNGRLWASDDIGGVYILDKSNGTAAAVGNTGLPPTPDIYFDQAGNLYGSSGGGGVPNNLISIDKATGAGTVIGSIGFEAVSGMAARMAPFAPDPALPGVCYATLGNSDPNAGSLITIDLATGAGTLVGPTGIMGDGAAPGVPALAISSAGEMYATDIGDSSNLYQVDPATGVSAQVGNMGIMAVGAMVFDSNDQLYATDWDGDLYTVDEHTAEVTLVGATGAGLKGLAVDPLTGILWATDFDGNLYTIDKSTAALTPVGYVGWLSIPDLCFDAAGNLYASEGGGTIINDLLSVDKATGAGTVIGPIGFEAVSGMATRLLQIVPVTLSSLTATRQVRDVVIEWVVSDLAGERVQFHVYRQIPEEALVKVTTDPLHGQTRYEFTDTSAPNREVHYWLEEMNESDERYMHGPITVGAGPALRLAVAAYPNPFNPSTTIRYTVPEDGPVTLAIYNVKGQLVRKLVNNEQHRANQYEVKFEPSVASGVYFVRLSAGKKVATQKIVLLK